MLLNKFLFPAPKPAEYTLTSHRANLFWLPADSNNQSPIPCMFYSPTHSNCKIEYLMIFCHGNGCDIGSMHHILDEFSKTLNIYIVSFEYPSYGLCTTSSPNESTINNHADRTYNFVHKTLNWPAERIIVYGHSIGSGTACYLASNQLIATLILQSPYTAVGNLIREKVGLLSLLINTPAWNNLEAMKSIKCPVLFLHGTHDTLIPSNHSQILHDACGNPEKKLILLRNEDHNSMGASILLKYITPFIEKISRSLDRNISLPVATIQRKFREPPDLEEIDSSHNSSNRILNSLYAVSRASTNATMSTIRSISAKRREEPDEHSS